jgi:5'-3' exonuclease
MDIHLIDGTYELFRHHFALPPHANAQGRHVAATRGVLSSVLMLMESGATHVGVATDHVVESFRNGLWSGYKRGEGIDPDLLQQFPLLEAALTAMGVIVWPMIELEADDALGAAAAQVSSSPEVQRVYICTPDKDLAQCVEGDRVVQFDRRKRLVMDEAAVIEKFGVPPTSIPDYLALVGDSSDGFPGLPGWGTRSAAAVLARWGHLEAVPDDPSSWEVVVRGAERLNQTLIDSRDLAYLFRDLATLRTDGKLFESVEDLRWNGPVKEFDAVSLQLDAPDLAERANAVYSSRYSHSIVPGGFDVMS